MGQDEAELMAKLQEEIRNLPVSDHLVYMLHSLSALAVGRLGLTADTAGSRDLAQAGLAIDAFKALLTVLEKTLPGSELSAHRGMLAQLQLAYAGAKDAGEQADGASQGSGAEEAAGTAVESPDENDA